MPTIYGVLDRNGIKSKKDIIELSENYFFRGESNNWKYSTSSLLRELNCCQQEELEAFKRKVLVLMNLINKQSTTNDDIITIMIKLRHEGIETPLIDLTSNFFISLFFAALPIKSGSETSESNNEGKVKLFKKDQFVYKDCKKFNRKFILPLSFDQSTEKKPLIIKNINWMHPNIRKQGGVLCFSHEGKISCDSSFCIKKEEKEKIIEELNLLNINASNLFTRWEGISTSLILDNKKQITRIRDSSNFNEVFKIFNLYLEKYNFGIVKLVKDLESYERRVLYMRDTFRDIYCLKELPNSIKAILAYLEQEVYSDDGTIDIEIDYFSKRPKEKGVPKDRIINWKNTIIKIFELNRILTLDSSMLFFSKILYFVLDYRSWFRSGIIKRFEPSGGNKEPTWKDMLYVDSGSESCTGSILNRLEEIERIFQGIIESWIEYLKKNIYGREGEDSSKVSATSLKAIHSVFVKAHSYFSMENFFFKSEEKLSKDVNLEDKAKGIFRNFSTKMIVILLFVWLKPFSGSITYSFMNYIFTTVYNLFMDSIKSYNDFSIICKEKILGQFYNCIEDIIEIGRESKETLQDIGELIQGWNQEY